MNLFKKALSVGSGKLTSELNGIVEEINKKEQSFEKLYDEEIKTNIFLRCNEPSIKNALNLDNASEQEIFSKLRDLKDSF